MFRFRIIIAAAVTLPLPALAGEPTAASAAARPFVEYSDIAAPRQAGPWQLVDHRYDPAQKLAGAGFTYIHPEHRSVVVSVYVYPAGLAANGVALERGLADFRRDLQAAVEGGTYANLQERGASPFTVQLADHVLPGGNSDAAVFAALATRVDGGTVDGQKLQLRMDMTTSNRQPGDLPIQSNGYLFYKQLYYFKVRVSGAVSAMDDAAFQALADDAARILVPATEVTSVGACANASIDIKDGQQPEEMAASVSRQLAAQMRYNCRATAMTSAVAPSMVTEVVRIDYDPGDWASR